jgi:hypothetical protein
MEVVLVSKLSSYTGRVSSQDAWKMTSEPFFGLSDRLIPGGGARGYAEARAIRLCYNPLVREVLS